MRDRNWQFRTIGTVFVISLVLIALCLGLAVLTHHDLVDEVQIPSNPVVEQIAFDWAKTPWVSLSVE